MLSLGDVEIISLESIFSKISREDVFKHYIGDFKYGKVINSPLRKDKNPSWTIYYNNGNPIYKDLALGYNGDCIKFIMELFGLNFPDALKRIHFDIIKGKSLPSKTKKVSKVKKNFSFIQIKRRLFNNYDKLYWESYGIKQDLLDKFNIIPCSHVWVNEFMVYTYYYKNPCYAYYFNKDGVVTYKIYQPFGKHKWVSNVNSSIIQGWDQLAKSSNLLIITKSLKDVVVLTAMGYNSVAIQSENIVIKKSVMVELKSRFKNIELLFDYDEAGKTLSEKFTSKYSLSHKFIIDSKAKDISDYRKTYGFFETYKLLKEMYGNYI